MRRLMKILAEDSEGIYIVKEPEIVFVERSTSSKGVIAM